MFATDRHRFEYVGVSVTRRLCRPTGLELPTFVTTDDANGKAVDFAALEAADRHAFHSSYRSMEPGFRDDLEKSPEEPVEAYVWFHVDESDAAAKELLLGDAVATAQAEAARENKIRGGAAQLKLKLGQVEGMDVITDVAAPKEYGIPVLRVRGTLKAFDAIGGWAEVWRIDPLPPEPTLASDTYYYTTLETVLDGAYGYDGTGIIVAQFEGGYPDSWQQLTGARVGNCPDVWNTWRECHCPAGSYTFHSRLTAGIYRRSSGIQGMSNAATTIAANHGGNCTTNGPDNYASALNWATSQGARVIGHSECTSAGTAQTAHDRFFDYKASVYPYPLVASAGGNDPAAFVCNKRRNNIVVGGAKESPGNSSRALVTDDNKSFINPGGTATGFELPHIVAISADVDSAGSLLGGSGYTTGGTSMAAPEVGGIVASLYEANSSIRSWPEVVIPGLMVSANEDVDNTILNLSDGVDDRDGAGLVNAQRALTVLQASSYVNSGNAPIRAGHHYGTIYSGSTPAGTFLSDAYYARVPTGLQVRIAGLLQSRPVCPQNPGFGDCSSDPYPVWALYVYDGPTIVAASISSNNNYQYVAFTNTSGVQRDYTIKIYLGGWSGLPSTTFGVAWDSYP